jgi:hypothetical protein
MIMGEAVEERPIAFNRAASSAAPHPPPGTALGHRNAGQRDRRRLSPANLIELLRAHLDRHGHDHVFTGRDGGLHRRSSFHRRH